MSLLRPALCAFSCLMLFTTHSGAAPVSSLDSSKFPLAGTLEPNVRFWTTVYSTHDSHRVLLHDERYLDIVYAVIDFSRLEAADLPAIRKRARRREEMRHLENKYSSILRALAAGRPSRAHAADRERVERLFARIPGGTEKYTAAISRLRTQTCLRDKFAEGLGRSGLYMKEFERIFTSQQLPIELTRLPFVESLFQTNARSAASAGGLWQFVPSTARSYLDMTPEVDERYDPFKAAVAAARLLAENYRSLKSWPLAITAYNHGRGGMRRAVRKTGTQDLGIIVQKYRSRTFGFASRNFYSEFLAAGTVYDRREQLFPSIRPQPAQRSDRFSPPKYVHLPNLARSAGIELGTLRRLNPALTKPIWKGELFLPRAYELRVPVGSEQRFGSALAALGAADTSPHQVGFRYLVRPGDTLSSIAARHGTTASSLQRANNLRSANRIVVGQQLLITSVRGPAGAGAHRVGPGESLSSIAGKYSTSVSVLSSLNKLGDKDRILVGQLLRVPSSSPGVHVVRPGESLSSIARKYGTSVDQLRRVNRIKTNVIQPAQVLVIPK